MKFLKQYWYFFAGGLILIGLAVYYFVVLKAKKEAEKKEAETLGTGENPLTLDKLPPVPATAAIEGAANIWPTEELWENAVNRYYAINVKEGKIPITTDEKNQILDFISKNTQLNELNARAAWVALRQFVNDSRFPKMQKTDENAQKIFQFFLSKNINVLK